MTSPRNAILEKIAEDLAVQAADRRTRPVTLAEKRALAASDILTAIGNNPHVASMLSGAQGAWDNVKNTPELSHSLAGGAIGAGLGGLGAFAGGIGREDDDKPSIFRSMLQGGAAGAGLGLASGALSRSHGATASPPQIGHFTGPGGKKFNIDPRALQDNPELAQTVRGLTEPTTAETALNKAWSGAKGLFGLAPTSASTLPFAGAADYALHSNRLRLGDRFGGRLGGMIDPRHSTQDSHLSRGITDIAELDPGKDPGFKGGFGPKQQDIIRDIHGRADFFHEGEKIPRMSRADIISGMNATREGVPFISDDPTHQALFVLSPAERAKVHETTRGSLGSDAIKNLRGLGAKNNFADLAKSPWYEKAPSQPAILRRSTLLPKFLSPGMDRDLTTLPHLGTRGAKRLMFYGGLPLAEMAARTAYGQASKQQTLEDIINSMRQQGTIRPE